MKCKQCGKLNPGSYIQEPDGTIICASCERDSYDEEDEEDEVDMDDMTMPCECPKCGGVHELASAKKCKMCDGLSELEKVLKCLYIAVEAPVADDVNRVVRAVIAQKDSMIETLRSEVTSLAIESKNRDLAMAHLEAEVMAFCTDRGHEQFLEGVRAEVERLKAENEELKRTVEEGTDIIKQFVVLDAASELLEAGKVRFIDTVAPYAECAHIWGAELVPFLNKTVRVTIEVAK